MSDEAVLQAVNVICNTLQVIALSYIAGKMPQGRISGREDPVDRYDPRGRG
jgi:hypothetical protein